MNPARLDEIRDLFERVCDLNVDARAAVLEKECVGDPELLSAVQRSVLGSYASTIAARGPASVEIPIASARRSVRMIML